MANVVVTQADDKKKYVLDEALETFTRKQKKYIDNADKEIADGLEEVKEAQAEDLQKITELAGKLNGIDSVSAELDKKADKTAVEEIEGKIPTQASASNQLADKDFVNSSIATNTADFKGTFNSLEELQKQTADANDYGFVETTDDAGNTVYKRYKYVEGEGWKFEYELNNSSFTAEQWAAIQSGVTRTHVEKVDRLKGLWVSDIKQDGGYIQITFKSFYDGVETTKEINFVTINGQSIFRSGDLQFPTKNEFDAVEQLAESVNQGLGEVEKDLEEEFTEAEAQELFTQIYGEL